MGRFGYGKACVLLGIQGMVESRITYQHRLLKGVEHTYVVDQPHLLLN